MKTPKCIQTPVTSPSRAQRGTDSPLSSSSMLYPSCTFSSTNSSVLSKISADLAIVCAPVDGNLKRASRSLALQIECLCKLFWTFLHIYVIVKVHRECYGARWGGFYIKLDKRGVNLVVNIATAAP